MVNVANKTLVWTFILVVSPFGTISVHADLGFSVDSDCLVGGQSTTGRVNVTNFICPPEPCPIPPCPPGPCLPAKVELSSGSPSIVSVPDSVFVIQGEGATEFSITT